MSRLGAALVAGALLSALLGPWLSPFDPSTQELALRLSGPTMTHWFGLDELGRDILTRVLVGARVSWMVGLVVVSVSATLGVVLGALAGFCGGRVDDAISRTMDVVLAFPGLLLAIALVAVRGPSLVNVVSALAAVGWVGYARVVRSLVLRARELDYVHAAHALGATPWRVLRHHVISVAWPALTVQATLGMGGAIVSEASLSFLGLGIQPPTPSWGTMLAYGRVHLLDAPHLTIFPGVAMAALVVGFNLLGDGLRDRLDPAAARNPSS